MNTDLALIDNFGDWLILKEGYGDSNICVLELHNRLTDSSKEFGVTIGAAKLIVKRLQYHIDCNTIGV